MKKKRLLKDEAGFTLIEIIAVLVILGILAAVAVPKFFDLQSKAREKALEGAKAEMSSRINQHFAQGLLEGEVGTAINFATTGAKPISTNIGSDFTISGWNGVKGSTTITFKITSNGTPTSSLDATIHTPLYKSN